MKRFGICIAAAALAAFVAPNLARSEILAMLNYESKPAESLKALKLTSTGERKEGIAIIDVDPNAPTFGRILMDIPLPPDLVAHHIFYDRKQEKAYVTALGKPELHVFNLNEYPYRLKKIDVPKCQMGEDVIFSEDNSTWYLTCMNSANVYVGDTATDKITGVIDIPGTNPHGLVVLSDIDRLLVTSTITGDLKSPQEELSVVEISTHKVLGKLKMSNKKSPSGVAPVELLRVPGSDPAIVYTTNMFGASLWTATWNPAKKDFDVAEAFDLAPVDGGVPLEMYFVDGGKTMYVTTANPGLLHKFDMSMDPAKPKLLYSLKTGEGARAVAVGGSTGEGHTLDAEETRDLVGAAIEASSGRVPIIAGIICDSTREAVRRGRMVADLGPVALQVTPVHYLFRPSDEAMVEHFRTMAAETGQKIILYNVVPWTYLSPALLVRIMDEVPEVIGVKQSAGDLKLFADLMADAQPDKLIFSAVDALMYPSYVLGAHGSIAAILTAAPGPSVKLWDAVKAGDQETALDLHVKLLRLWNALMPHDNLPAATKYAQSLQGVPSGLPRQPMPPADEKQRKDIKAALDGLGIV